MAYSTPATWTAGAVLTAAQLNAQLRDNLNAAFPLGVDGWTPYTPTLTAGTVGNGTLTGRYTRVGRTVTASGRFVLGSSSTITGNLLMNLPVASANQGVRYLGKAYYLDAGTREWVGAANVGPNDTVVRLAHTEAGGLGGVNATSPFTFATGDEIAWTVTYEAAA